MPNNPPSAEPTEAEIEEKRAAVAAWDARQAELRAEERQAHLKPLTDLLASPAYAEVRDALTAIGSRYDDDPAFGAFVSSIRTGVRYLDGAAVA